MTLQYNFLVDVFSCVSLSTEFVTTRISFESSKSIINQFELKERKDKFLSVCKDCQRCCNTASSRCAHCSTFHGVNLHVLWVDSRGTMSNWNGFVSLSFSFRTAAALTANTAFKPDQVWPVKHKNSEAHWFPNIACQSNLSWDFLRPIYFYSFRIAVLYRL